MHCLVAIKRVQDPYTGAPIMNPFDEIAIEEAVLQKQKSKLETITAISIGNTDTQEVLRQALARGADRAILLNTEQSLSPLLIAKILAYICQQENISLALLGKQAIDDDSNQVGQMLAAILGWSQGTFISKLDIDVNTKHLQIKRELDSGQETLELSLPSVLTTDLRLNQPRYLSLPNIMAAKSKPLQIQELNDLNMNFAPMLKTLTTTTPAARQAGIILSTVEELVDKLKHEAKVI